MCRSRLAEVESQRDALALQLSDMEKRAIKAEESFVSLKREHDALHVCNVMRGSRCRPRSRL